MLSSFAQQQGCCRGLGRDQTKTEGLLLMEICRKRFSWRIIEILFLAPRSLNFSPGSRIKQLFFCW